MVKISLTKTAYFMLATTLFFVSTAPCGLGSDYKHDLPYEAIRRLQPALKHDRAKRLARAFENVAKREGVDWRLLVSISFHETSLGLHTVNSKSGDYGLMQLNKKIILHYGLSHDRVMSDAEYSLTWACRLLKENQKRYGSKYTYWLGIYRSGTALHRSEIRANAKSYDKIVRHTAGRIGYNSQLAAR
jgi:hypothetical protein